MKNLTILVFFFLQIYLGAGFSNWLPAPPERGSFPLDHDSECSTIMKDYLTCLKLVHGTNAHGCRLLAKSYLKCRMDHGLMDHDEWKNLGLPEDDKPIIPRKLDDPSSNKSTESTNQSPPS